MYIRIFHVQLMVENWFLACILHCTQPPSPALSSTKHCPMKNIYTYSWNTEDDNEIINPKQLVVLLCKLPILSLFLCTPGADPQPTNERKGCTAPSSRDTWCWRCAGEKQANGSWKTREGWRATDAAQQVSVSVERWVDGWMGPLKWQT